jgi:hypothetical protein
MPVMIKREVREAINKSKYNSKENDPFTVLTTMTGGEISSTKNSNYHE